MLSREDKKQVVSWVKSDLIAYDMVIMVKHKGIDGNSMTKFRNELWQSDAGCKIVKNSLLKLGLTGSRLESLIENAAGQTALIYANDFVQATKIVDAFAKDKKENFEIVSGVMGANVLSKGDIKVLATLPSLDELRAKILTVIQTPATRIACVVKEPATRVARVLGMKK